MSSVVVHKSQKNVGTCKVHLIHLQVLDVKGKLQEVFDIISDTSWIGKLNSKTAQLSYEVAAKRTILKLAADVLANATNTLTAKSGEYVISVSAAEILKQEHQHVCLPIAELWKEQVSGNPGFDFHTVTTDQILLFGEAKYRSDGNPHGNALDQITELISAEKDVMDLVHLENFVGAFPIERFKSGFKAYCAAFSVNAADAGTIIENAASSQKAQPLMVHSELHLIGVELVS